MIAQTQAEQTVLNFFGAWSESHNSLLQSFRDFFTEETIWENVGVVTTKGPDEAIAVLSQFPFDIARIDVETLSIATANGDVVHIERLDYCWQPDGALAIKAQVAGVLEVKNGKIAAWRDYFDTASMAPAPLS